jgi:hypothetical protein
MKRRPLPARPASLWRLRFVSQRRMCVALALLAGAFFAPAARAAEDATPAAVEAAPPVGETPAQVAPQEPAQAPGNEMPPVAPTLPAPVATPVAETKPVDVAPAAQASQPAAPTPPTTPSTMKDELSNAGYLPGYRSQPSLSLSPYSPQVGGLPGGVMPSFMAPMPPGEWTSRFSGFLTASAQYSSNDRLQTGPGQSTLIFHGPPATIEEYASFLSTSSVPGNWVAMNFQYGNRDVTATVNITTWNPTQPTTYYQIGSEQFLGNTYLNFNIPELIEKLHLAAKIGYFYNTYGSLGQFSLGMYQNPIAAAVRGVGGTLTAEYDLSPKLTFVVEEGFVGNRNGSAPSDTNTQSNPGIAGPNGNYNPAFPAAYVQHLHAGLVRRGDTTIRTQLHYIYNWSQDGSYQAPVDNQVTRYVDESYIRDGKLAVYSADLNLSHPAYGAFALAASHLGADYASTLRGVNSFGGEGQTLTERWLGSETTGTGTVNVVGINYSGSLGRILSHPKPFDASSPDLAINAGAVIANSHSTNPLFDGRVRYKAGLDLFYNFMANMGVGVRFDRVAPNSKDASETFHVLAPRLVLRTSWMSRENISLMYAKWFYGAHTHGETSGNLPPRFDDQLFALNVNVWW